MELKKKPTFVVVALPRLSGPDNHPQNLALAQKYRALRLHALKTSPEAFAASYESESERELDHTLQRLKDEKAVNLVVVESSKPNDQDITSPDETESILEIEWDGMICLLGPQERGAVQVSAKEDMFSRMTDKALANHEPQEPLGNLKTSAHLHYHLNGTFVGSSARKGGLGTKLIDAAVQRASLEAETLGKGLVITVHVDDRNMAARRLYEKAGFEVAGHEMYIQQPRSLVEGGDSRARERLALRLELQRDVGVS